MFKGAGRGGRGREGGVLLVNIGRTFYPVVLKGKYRIVPWLLYHSIYILFLFIFHPFVCQY